MGFVNFNILLYSHSGFFSPGQTVTGNVHITNTEVKCLKGIYVKCSGKAKVRIPGKQRNQSETEEFYCGKEKYFEIKYSLHNSSSHVFHLGIGQHTFPFTFVLPMQIPSSFEGEYGHVRYVIRASAQLPCHQSQHKCKTILVVCSSLDLNTIPRSAFPVTMTKSKNICCLFCSSGPICAQAQIQRAGYVPGETIFVNADTENNSGKDMRSSRVQLVQKTTFLAEGQTRTDSKVLQEYNHGEFTHCDIMENVQLVIPPRLPPSDLPFCGIINVSYLVQYVVDPGPFSFNLTVPLDVIIGTVPLYNSASFAYRVANTASNQHIGCFPVSPPGMSTPFYQDIGCAPVSGVPNTSYQDIGFKPSVVPNRQSYGTIGPSAPPPVHGEYFQSGEPGRNYY